MGKNLTAVRDRNGLVISGFSQPIGEREAWQVSSFNEDFLLAKKAAASTDTVMGASFCSTDVFADFLLGMHLRKWSGAVVIDSGYGEKRLYLRDGELVFATSDLFDDRLGEIAYRKGMITLDQLTESAAKVTRGLRFGQVSVRSGIFTDFELWLALKEQVKEILKSVFMVDSVYFELGAGRHESSEVIFSEGAASLVESCYGYGAMFRSFVETLKPTSWVTMQNPARAEEGTFLGDLIAIIGRRISVKDFINQSKLQRPYILSALMDLVNRGVCLIEEAKVRTFDEYGPKLFAIRKLVKAYEIAVKIAQKAFEDESMLFPIADLRSLVSSFNIDMPVFFLDPSGNISPESTYSIYSQCSFVKGRYEFFEIRIKSLIEFLVQVTGDHLSDAVVRQIRSSIREYYA
ncbi:MAG: DUF4388 domain-containing protein [Deltaproteobacteria bacterium]|nr:DUF4388 domain-containing protein [Deltaproteobacteria bacterium]